ncbi:MAG: FAD-dependent monooxygenase [Rhodospirillales bacterium]
MAFHQRRADSETPLLIVGGRTTGLMLAIELARRAIPVRIVDKSPGIDPHSRATLLHVRSLELLQGLGLADSVWAAGQPDEGVRVYVDKVFLRRQDDPPVDSPFPTGVAFSQAKLEGLLEAYLADLGVRVERSTQLLGLSQDAGGLRATLGLSDGGEEIVDAPWLIGCDGAHSQVRRSLDIPFTGDDSRYPYLLADVTVAEAEPESDAFYFLHPAGQLYFFLLDEGRRLICASLPEDHDTRGAPTLAQVQALVGVRSQPQFRLADPRWLAYFRIRYRLAASYRRGRAFLAGDAAHLNSLIGGQGMNTGIQDACNLAWKLALVERGIAGERLLDSYETERRPIAEEMIATTKAMTEPGERYPAMSPAGRRALVADLFPPPDQVPAFRRHFEEIDLDLGDSPLSRDEMGVAAMGAAATGPRAGLEARDATGLRVEGETRSLFGLLGDVRHCLLVFAGEDDRPEATELAEATHRRFGDWIATYLVSREPQRLEGPTSIEDPGLALTRRYEMTSGGLYLIRPDGYIAYRAARFDGLEAYLAGVYSNPATAGG